MLTKSDLSQIQKVIHTEIQQETKRVVSEEISSFRVEVREIVKEEIENEVKALKETLQSDIVTNRMRLQNDIGEVKDSTKNVEIRITKMHKELKEEIKLVSHTLDKNNMSTLKRVKKIEDHLGLAA